MAVTLQSNNISMNSASGLLSLLVDTEFSLRVYALKQLNNLCDQFWSEIAESITDIEELYENEAFEEKELAALVLSKVYYHLEAYDEALNYALGVGTHLDIFDESQYVQTIVAKAIDEYICLRSEKYDRENSDNSNLDEEMSPDNKEIDERLEAIIERILASSIKDEKQILGISFDARRLDKVEEILKTSSNKIALLEHCVKNAENLISIKQFRIDVMKIVSDIYNNIKNDNFTHNDYSNLCVCLFYQNNANGVANILNDLLNKQNDCLLIAYQIAFDLADFEDQSFLSNLLKHPLLQIPTETISHTQITSSSLEDRENIQNEEIKENYLQQTLQRNRKIYLERLHYILSGEASIDLRLQFVHSNNKSDLNMLHNMMNWNEYQQFVIHSIFLAHGFMQAGTTSDAFLRQNLEYFVQASNWIKFSATATLGIVYKWHIKQSRRVLADFLPSDNTHHNPFTVGGALYALGLIHANHSDNNLKQYITKYLIQSEYNVIKHGACLGVGLLCLGQNDEELFEHMKDLLLKDIAIIGEAAAYGMGMLMLANGNNKFYEILLLYAHETKHEKIIRSCAVSISFIMFKREQQAENVIQSMCEDKDPLIRYGGMFVIGMAYCGTANNSAVRRLLHISVSDVSDDVRRASVIALGFVLCNLPDEAPKMLKLLTESYNPHVRYGAALALGVSTSGTGNEESVALLTFLVADTTEFVRQGALIALGLVLQQATQYVHQNINIIKNLMTDIAHERQEDKLTRFGAFIAIGLINGGGCNCKASILGRNNIIRPEAAVGFLLFTQMWYWYPLIPCISLAFQPTAIIGLTKSLKMAQNFYPICLTQKSSFDYPPPHTIEPKEQKKTTNNTILSFNQQIDKYKNTKKKNVQIKKSSSENEPKTINKSPDDMGSVSSDMPSANRGMDISSTAGTVGGQSSRLSHTGSLADSYDDGNININIINNVEDVYTLEDTSIEIEQKNKKTKGESKPIHKIQNSADEKTSKNPTKETTEPSFFTMQNPCRVLPSQEKYIKFDKKGRYYPILNNRTSGFILLKDREPNLPNEFEEYDAEDVPAPFIYQPNQ